MHIFKIGAIVEAIEGERWGVKDRCGVVKTADKYNGKGGRVYDILWDGDTETRPFFEGYIQLFQPECPDTRDYLTALAEFQ